MLRYFKAPIIQKSLFIAGLLLVTSSAWAFPIKINPNGYQGSWYVKDVMTEFTQGERTLDLPAGVYIVQVGAVGSFVVDVEEDGSLYVENNSAVEVVGNEIKFRTSTVTIDPGAYSGYWYISYVSGELHTGVHSYQLVPGLNYSMRVGSGGNVGFSLAGDGTTTPFLAASAEGGAGQLKLKTILVSIDPEAYAGLWYFQTASTSPYSGAMSMHLVPGLAYILRVGAIGILQVNLEANGSVDAVGSAAVTSGNIGAFKFVNRKLRIDPQQTENSWAIDQAYEFAFGPRELVFPKGLEFRVLSGVDRGQFLVPAETCAADALSFIVGSQNYLLACVDPVTQPDPETPDTETPDTENDPDLDNDPDTDPVIGNPEDVDGDGVKNTLDLCPGTPSEEATRRFGCSPRQIIELRTSGVWQILKAEMRDKIRALEKEDQARERAQRKAEAAARKAERKAERERIKQEREQEKARAKALKEQERIQRQKAR